MAVSGPITQYRMHDAPDNSLPASDDDTRSPRGWDVLVLMIAAGSASAAALLDIAYTPLLIVVGLACLNRLERTWRP